MNFNKILPLFLLIVALFLQSCGPKVANYGIRYPHEKNIRVLDYHYYNSHNGGIRGKNKYVKKGSGGGILTRGGPMYVVEYFYVKWYDRRRHVVKEQRVNLVERLPDDMNGLTLEFTLDKGYLQMFTIETFRPKRLMSFDKKRKAEHMKNFVWSKKVQIYPEVGKDF